MLWTNKITILYLPFSAYAGVCWESPKQWRSWGCHGTRPHFQHWHDGNGARNLQQQTHGSPTPCGRDENTNWPSQVTGKFTGMCFLLSLITILASPVTLIFPHAFCSVDAKQEYQHLGLGTPPVLLRQNSLGRPPTSTARHTDEEGSLRRRAVKVGKKFFPQF